METLRINEERIKQKLRNLNFSFHQINNIIKVYEEVDEELTVEGWSY